MGHYTVADDPRVDIFVEEHMKHIIGEVCNLMGNDLDAAVLSGGFGRGEGSVLIKSDGTMHVINDYDIDLIPRARFGGHFGLLISKLHYRAALAKLADRLADELDIKQVDLGLRSRASHAATISPRLADYDLKHGHKLLYGESDPVDDMPTYRPAEIPIFEGTWLLRNRAIGLLLAYFYLGPNDSLANQENFYIEINKAVLAMGDALFIEAGTYTCSYAERARKIGCFSNLPFDDISELIRLYTLASEYKLRPTLEMYPGTFPHDLWHQIKDIYVALFIFYESRRLNRKIDDWSEYLTEYRPVQCLQAGDWIKLLFPVVSGKESLAKLHLLKLKQDRFRSVPFILLLLASRGRDELTPAAVSELNSMLGKPYHDFSDAFWHTLVRDFLLLVHPGGEIGRFLGQSTASS